MKAETKISKCLDKKDFIVGSLIASFSVLTLLSGSIKINSQFFVYLFETKKKESI